MAAPPPAPRLGLDTNTVLALWMFRDPALASLRAQVEAGGAVLLSRADALEELRRVLAYRQFDLGEATRDALFDDYLGRVALVPADDGTAGPLSAFCEHDDHQVLQFAPDRSSSELLSRDKALL